MENLWLRNSVSIFFVALFTTLFLSGCGDDEIDANIFSSGSELTKEQKEANENMDKASYKGLENLFLDTANIDSNGKYLLMIFGKNNCQYCDMLKDDIKADTNLQNKIAKDFTPYYINVSYTKKHKLNVPDKNGKKEMEMTTGYLAERYKIRPTPTIVFSDMDSKIIFSYPGYMAPSQFDTTLDFIVSKKWVGAKNEKETLERLEKFFREKSI